MISNMKEFNYRLQRYADDTDLRLYRSEDPNGILRYEFVRLDNNMSIVQRYNPADGNFDMAYYQIIKAVYECLLKHNVAEESRAMKESRAKTEEKSGETRTYAPVSDMTKNEYIACELTKAYMETRTSLYGIEGCIDIYEKFVKELNARERLGGAGDETN